jgi:uncharacterized membrane protein YqhA
VPADAADTLNDPLDRDDGSDHDEIVDPPRRELIARFAERSIVLAVVAAFALFVTSMVTFVWGLSKVWAFIDRLLDDGSDASLAIVDVLEVIDIYLLGAVLLILSIGIVELFVTSLDLPSWLEIHSLTDMKAKLIDVIQLVAAIKFLEKLVTAEEALEVLWYALAVSVVILALVAVRWSQRLAKR